MFDDTALSSSELKNINRGVNNGQLSDHTIEPREGSLKVGSPLCFFVDIEEPNQLD